MLKSISWSQYWLFLTLAAGAWYFIVLLRWMTHRKPRTESVIKTTDRTALLAEAPGDPGQPEMMTGFGDATAVATTGAQVTKMKTIAQAVSDEIRDVLREGANEDLDAAVMKARLNVILCNYADLRATQYGDLVDDFIVRGAQALGYEWTTEEVRALWN